MAVTDAIAGDHAHRSTDRRPLLSHHQSDGAPFRSLHHTDLRRRRRRSSTTDTIGIVWRFRLDAQSLVNRLTTPYGDSDAAFGASNVAPAGDVPLSKSPNRTARHRVDRVQTQVIAATLPRRKSQPEVPARNDYLHWRNSFSGMPRRC